MQRIRTRARALFIWCIFSLIWSSCTHSHFSIHTAAMVDDSASVPQPSSTSESEAEASVYIVFLEFANPESEDLESSHIRTLASVLGSDEAAKKAMVYFYRNLGNIFAARLTPKQASEISKQPGVLQVIPSRSYQLHSGPAMPNV